MPGRFIRSRDLEFFDTVNKELIGDVKARKDGIISQEVIVYKIRITMKKHNLNCTG